MLFAIPYLDTLPATSSARLSINIPLTTQFHSANYHPWKIGGEY